MPATETTDRAEIAAAIASPGVVRETRFDPPHEIARGDAPATTSAAASSATANEVPLEDLPHVFVGESATISDDSISPALIAQFRKQAAELAAHLDERQRALDAREAEFHSALAQHDSATRSARLWFKEQQQALAERQQRLVENEQLLGDLDQRAAIEAVAEQAARDLHAERHRTLTAREDELNFRELEIHQRRAELNELAVALGQRELCCEAREQKIAEREAHLEAAEAMIARAHADVADATCELTDARDQWQEHVSAEQSELATARRQWEIEAERQRATLADRANQLELRSAALDSLRAELLHTQRETLEMRLATEELWGQLSGLVPPAAITQSLAQLRGKLAEHFRLQAAEIAAQRQELEQLAAKIADQHARLATQKQQREADFARQHATLEEQAAQLVAREVQLQHDADCAQQIKVAWDAERRSLEREIRRLQKAVRSATAQEIAMV